MRLDVFLKQTRLVKRRSLAKELCDEGAVELNGRPARAGREVGTGDTIVLTLRHRRLELEILDVPQRPPSTAHATEFYRMINDARIDDERDD